MSAIGLSGLGSWYDTNSGQARRSTRTVACPFIMVSLVLTWLAVLGPLPSVRHVFAQSSDRLYKKAAERVAGSGGSLAQPGHRPASAIGFVNESARAIPVAYDVDVVVVGGGTGAVEAARTAARAGARVFLAAPYPYLGDDMTATLRLWLEPGEEPDTELAERIYSDPVRLAETRSLNTLPFTYKADRPSAARHPDTKPPSRLADGVWGDPVRHSVQFDGNVSITCDLHKVQPVYEVRLVAFHRASSNRAAAYRVRDVTVSVSEDGQKWWTVGVVENGFREEINVLTVTVERRARFVRLDVTKTDDCDRILLAEIEIVGPPKPAPPVPVSYPPPRPLHVKKVLDDALIEAGVRFLYSCLPTDVVVDETGRPCGVVIANRAGRQAVLAKTIVDATWQGTVARLAGAKVVPAVEDRQTVVRRVVIGGEPVDVPKGSFREIDPPFFGRYPNPADKLTRKFPIIEYALKMSIPDDGPAGWAALEQKARDLTYHLAQQTSSDVLFVVPHERIEGETTFRGEWGGVERIPIGAFRPRDLPNVWLLNGVADVPREVAKYLLRPVHLIKLGQRIGAAAAEQAAKMPAARAPRVAGRPTESPAAEGDVREVLSGLRPADPVSRTIPQDALAVPVLGQYDVVVIGGGTAGAPAGIAAARNGARTLVVEYLSELGGVGTAGAISKYYWGNRVGFTATVPGLGSWIPEQKAEWWRKALREAGADIWFGTLGYGAFVDGKVVKGVVVSTPWGRGVVLAKVVIDTTGNADIAAAAGAECSYTDASEFAMQGTGLPPIRLGATYTNTDFTIVDETDPVDVWHVLVYAKEMYPDAFDQGKLIDTRERRRIVGDFVMTLTDQINGRTYPDTVVISYSNFDTHGYTIDPYLELEHPERKGFYVNVPYRCCLPRGLRGILVGGLGMSVHRDAVPLTRMQADLQNQGYALGLAAALAVRDRVPPRQINVRELQRRLVELGNLPKRVLTETDNYPLPDERVRQAVQTLPDNYKGASVVMAAPDRSLPLLRKAYRSARGDAKVIYAHVLAVLGDPTGLDTLLQEVEKYTQWDEGWNYRGMGQFGSSLSRLDRLIIALGRAGDRRAVPTILKKLKLLTAQHAFSHHRAAALALELLRDPRAAEPLAELLAKPGMTGHVIDSIEKAKEIAKRNPNTSDVSTRRDSLRELVLARALFRCGDYKDLGKRILQQYTHDLRGHLARHARAVLEAGPDWRPSPVRPTEP